MDEASIEQPRGYDTKPPLRGTSEQDRIRLGVLLQRRRGELGYLGNGRHRFARERDINRKGIYDIEKATRDGFMVSTLVAYARAYEVTYESLVAVGRGEADELTAAFRADELADDPSGESLQELSIERARARLGDVVDRARYTGDPTLITRNGKPAALMTPILGRSDLGVIAIARQPSQIRDLAEARDLIEDLLYTLDRYLAADKNLDASLEQDAGSAT